MSHVTISDSTFEDEVLKAEGLVIVDFWAEWCMPCRMLGPIIEELASEYEGKVKVAKLNVDENQQIAGQYQVTGIPTVIFFKNGEIVDRYVGVQPKGVYENAIKNVIGE